VTKLSTPAKGILAGGDTHITRCRSLTLHPSKLCIAVCEYARPGQDHVGSRLGITPRRSGNVLVIRPGEPQPLFAFHFLMTEHHSRTVTVPIDGGDLDVVPARE
jgi:hypothetical protein